jgi:PLP dependent protein
MDPVSVEQFARNLAYVKEKISAAQASGGRNVKLMAVTKGLAREAVDMAAAAGIRLFGENRVQEAETKYGVLPAAGELHLIGHLQRNKAAKVAALFTGVDSIDRLETAVELARHAAALGKKIPILLQVNVSGEESKSGYTNQDLLSADLEKLLTMDALIVTGLMTIGPLTDDAAAIRRGFASLRELFETIGARFRVPEFKELSMGMSGDYEIAVQEGSTLVRIGTALFGERGK